MKNSDPILEELATLFPQMLPKERTELSTAAYNLIQRYTHLP